MAPRISFVNQREFDRISVSFPVDASTELLKIAYTKLYVVTSSDFFFSPCLLPCSSQCTYCSPQQQQTDPNIQDISTQSWYPPSVVGSSSRPSTPASSSASPHQTASDHPQSSSRGQPSPAEAAGIIARLKDKRLARILMFFHDLLL